MSLEETVVRLDSETKYWTLALMMEEAGYFTYLLKANISGGAYESIVVLKDGVTTTGLVCYGLSRMSLDGDPADIARDLQKNHNADSASDSHWVLHREEKVP